MKEPYVTLLVIVITLALFTLTIGPVIRAGSISPILSTNKICELELGKNWVYDWDENFGKTCIELDYITLDIVNRTEYTFDIVEMIEKHCVDPPRFFELSRWDNGCDVNVAKPVGGKE